MTTSNPGPGPSLSIATACDTHRGEAHGDDTQALLADLSHREDLYHAASPAATPEAFEQVVAPDFWEIGASGRRYERAFCLQVLSQRGPTPAQQGWRVRDAQVQCVGADHCLLVYTLAQSGRVTLRSTLWRQSAQGWQAVFHQGTVLQP